MSFRLVLVVISVLSALDVDCVHALWGLFSLEGNAVAFLDFVKSDANQVLAVEEDILAAIGRSDETKTLVSLLFDSTLHSNRNNLVYNLAIPGCGPSQANV